MQTTINYTKDGKPVSKTFGSYDAIIRYFQTEIAKVETKEKALDRSNGNFPELRAMLRDEKADYQRTIEFYKHLIRGRKTIRNDLTGEVLEIEKR